LTQGNIILFGLIIICFALLGAIKQRQKEYKNKYGNNDGKVKKEDVEKKEN
jgi:hypothetical protein